MSYEEQEYHRRRSEMELEAAVSTESPASAIAHLELARMHRARRQIAAELSLAKARASYGAPIFSADKEA